MSTLEQCPSCESFVPRDALRCPDCGRSGSALRWLGRAGGGALAMTLMACYGAPPRPPEDGPPEPPVDPNSEVKADAKAELPADADAAPEAPEDEALEADEAKPETP